MWFGDTRRVLTLALGGHDLDVRDPRGYTPAQVAGQKHNLDALAILKICGATIDSPEHSLYTAADDGQNMIGYGYRPFRQDVANVVFGELRQLRIASKWQVAVYTNVLPAKALAELLRARRLPTPDHGYILSFFEMWGEDTTLKYANSIRSWSPSAHHSFPASYRQVVLLCIGVGRARGALCLPCLPVEVWQIVLAFISREDL